MKSGNLHKKRRGGRENGFLSFSEKNGIIAKIVDTKEVKKDLFTFLWRRERKEKWEKLK